MPRKIIPKKQEFVPLIEAKQTIEVEVKPRPSREDLETVEVIKKPRKKTTKKTRKKRTSTPKLPKELKGDSILIITEKPQAAAKISAALSGGKATQSKASPGVFYYSFDRDGESIIVTCAVGHLFSLAQNIKGSDYPIFDISWKPNFEVRKKDFTKKYYNSIAKLMRRAKSLVVATDYDTEGEVIGYNIVRFLGNQQNAKRMKFSALTPIELNKAYDNLEDNIDWGQALGGETRHYLDWFYGINLSRALMNSIKTTGKFKIMSIGRVQGPTLKLIVDKEKVIRAFIPTPFWRVFLSLVQKNNKIEVKYSKDITNKEELDKFEKLKGKKVDVTTKKTEQIIPPNPPFDLTSLQTESYKFFSLSPARTLQIAQKLYLAGIISYPRTSSQKIPDEIDTKKILQRLKKEFPEKVDKVTRDKPIEGKKSDPAHPAIHPTGELQKVLGDEKKVYNLIVKRFIASFCEDAKTENKVITAEVDELKFKARGTEIKEKGWMEVYEARLKEVELKNMDGKADIEEVKIEEDETKPPKRYSPASILTELEKRSLGTKATRANIIETLFNRNYVMGNKSIQATTLGIDIIEMLEKHSPIIIDEQLTKEIEKDIEEMQLVKDKEKLKIKQEKVLNESKETLKKISKDFHKNEKKIGLELIKAVQDSYKQEEKENNLGFKCPACNKGNLIIKYAPRFRRQFVACTSYPECRNTYGLPPNGIIKKTEKFCDHCKFPMMMRLQRGKRPWFFCFNKECASRKEYEEKKKLKMQEEKEEQKSE